LKAETEKDNLCDQELRKPPPPPFALETAFLFSESRWLNLFDILSGLLSGAGAGEEMER